MKWLRGHFSAIFRRSTHYICGRRFRLPTRNFSNFFTVPFARGPVAAALVIGVYFFRLTRGTIHAGFSPDDMMNLYRAWSFPLGMLVKANLLFFQTSVFYRPMGSAWYRAIYHFAGFNPAPFHIANLAILAANIFLTYAVARRLAGSREIGVLAALIGCYHTKFDGLYFDTGYVFDVLCYFFFFAAFLLYLRIRQAGRMLNARTMAACAALFICGLNSKEMAITLPLFLGIYEILYHPPKKRSELRRWILAEGRGTLVTGAIALLFAVGRVTGTESLLRIGDYRTEFSWHRLMETSSVFLNDLFFQPNWFTPLAVLLLWSLLLVVAWASRSKALRFAWLFLMLSGAPIAFVPPRGASQYYLPLFGWALYAATALVEATRWLAKRVRGPAAEWVESARAPLLFGATIALLYPYYKAQGWSNVASVRVDGVVIHSVAAQLRELHPALPASARMFFLDDPIDASVEDLLFIVRLAYGDNRITVDRLKKMKREPGESVLANYDYVFDYKDGRLSEPTRPQPAGLAPALWVGPRGPELYHADWSPVDAGHPARAGEVVIAKATGLGATSPEVPLHQPFPREPMAKVIARVEVRVNGRQADVAEQLGWPGEADLYRVDFRMPVVLRPGVAVVQFTVRGVEGAQVSVPVR